MNEPGCPSSIRTKILSDIPIIIDQEPNNKYMVPMSLWFVE